MVDVFLMRHSGNPFHKNPFVRRVFESEPKEAHKKIRKIAAHYDKVVVMNGTHLGVKRVCDFLQGLDNVETMSRYTEELRPRNPELYFSTQELESVRTYGGGILFHPFSSSYREISRTIDFGIIGECSKYFDKVTVTYGGRPFIPDELDVLESKGVKVFWENRDFFNDERGYPVGKTLALVSLCAVGVHPWSGSLCMSAAFRKPYVVVTPSKTLRTSPSAHERDTKKEYIGLINKMKMADCLGFCAWCITDRVEIVLEAIERVKSKEAVLFDGGWEKIE